MRAHWFVNLDYLKNKRSGKYQWLHYVLWPRSTNIYMLSNTLNAKLTMKTNEYNANSHATGPNALYLIFWRHCRLKSISFFSQNFVFHEQLFVCRTAPCSRVYFRAFVWKWQQIFRLVKRVIPAQFIWDNIAWFQSIYTLNIINMHSREVENNTETLVDERIIKSRQLRSLG